MTTPPSRSARVYPRVCGGTPIRRLNNTTPQRSIPALGGGTDVRGVSRSIPACAGEPLGEV